VFKNNIIFLYWNLVRYQDVRQSAIVIVLLEIKHYSNWKCLANVALITITFGFKVDF
jgi:hypothetical protein